MSATHNQVGWFEIPVTDLDRAQGFYEHVLGVALERRPVGHTPMAFFPMADNEYGAPGALVAGEHRTPSLAGTLVYFTTPDLDGAVARSAEKGGKTLLPRTGIGEYGFIAIVQDCEGNRIGLHSRG